MFYQIKQYGNLIFTHPDIEVVTEEEIKGLLNRISEKAKEHIEKGDMISGSFDVTVCTEEGKEVDHFITDADGVPES